MNAEQMLQLAREAARQAYCPYSKFQVGAAILMGDEIFTGCNVENASYGLAICAERTAIFTGVSKGKRKLQAVAVSCVSTPPETPENGRTPCGACRQVIREFADQDTLIHVDGVGTFTIEQLLPLGFKLDS